MNQRASYRQYGSSRPFISSVLYLEWLIHFDSNEDVPGQSRMHCRCAMDQYSISTLLIQTFGWGTGIRTQTDGFRGQRVLETLVLNHYTIPQKLVLEVGLEPTRLSAQESKSCMLCQFHHSSL